MWSSTIPWTMSWAASRLANGCGALLPCALLLCGAATPITADGEDKSHPPRSDHRPSSSATAGFSVEASGRQLDLRAGESVTLTSILPVAADQTLVIKDSAGIVVRTLVKACRPPGIFRDVWHGRGENNTRLPDGQYRWVATFDDGGHTSAIDFSDLLDGDYEVKSHAEYEPWAPFDNVPLRIGHTFERPGEILLVFSPVTFPIYPRCDPPQFCRWLDGFEPAGPFTYSWAGVDDSGALRSEVRAVLVISSHERLAKNGIVVHGGRPEISGLAVSPSYYRPDGGLQDLRFSLSSLGNDPVTVMVSWKNQESLSVLKALRFSGVKPGLVKAIWDGRADNGAPVAPGHYTVNVVVQDSLGNRATSEILTTVEQ